MSTCEIFKVNQKLSFYFKFVEFLCHKVKENGAINAVAGKVLWQQNVVVVVLVVVVVIVVVIS